MSPRQLRRCDPSAWTCPAVWRRCPAARARRASSHLYQQRARHSRRLPAERTDVTAAIDKSTADRLLAQLLAGRMPDAHGRFGPYGGRYIPETLVPAFDRLEEAVRTILPSTEFREELAPTGAHKINNALGQALIARRMGAKRVVAETGAGQHGVATAAACARVGLPCTVYMGEVDMARQAPNVGRMRLLGATVVPVTSGERTLRAAIDEAFRDWVADPS